MKHEFVKTSNVERFLAGHRAVKERGALEACYLLATGDAGLGKSETGEWWALQNNAVFVRVKAKATPHWILADVVRELGETAPAHSREKLFGQAITLLMRDPRPIVLDEVENALNGDISALEQIRDLSDLMEMPVLLLGREWVGGQLRKHKHFWSRISAHVTFKPITLDDVRLCASALLEVTTTDDVIEQIHAQSEGLIREVVKALKTVERIGQRKSDKKVVKDDVAHITLSQERPAARKAG